MTKPEKIMESSNNASEDDSSVENIGQSNKQVTMNDEKFSQQKHATTARLRNVPHASRREVNEQEACTKGRLEISTSFSHTSLNSSILRYLKTYSEYRTN